jgi:protein O-GlcNAc transferase
LQGAVDKFAKVLKLNPRSAIAHGEIGLSLFAAGQTDKAATYLKQAFDLVTDDEEKSDAVNWSMIRANYAFLLVRSQGSMKAVAKNFKKAALLHPDFADAFLYWGNALQELREPDSAKEAYRLGLERHPNHSVMNFQYAGLVSENLDLSEKHYRASIAADPNYSSAYTNLGTLMQNRGKLQDAIELYRHALQLKPDCAATYTNLGVSLQDLGRTAEAIAANAVAIQLNPKMAPSYNNFARAHESQHDYVTAMEAYDSAIALDPTYREAKCGLFFLEYMTARWTHREAHEMEGIAIAMDQVRGWAAGQPRGHRQHCVQPFRAFSMPISEPDLITLVVDTVREVVIENLRRGATPIAPAVTAAMAMQPFKRLRVAYISSDFGAHTVACLMRRMFTHHNKALFEIWALSTQLSPMNEWRAQMKIDAEHWMDMQDASDVDAAFQIQKFKIHILIDLNGQSKGGRAHVLLLRPAPVTINFLGYPETAGGAAHVHAGDRIASPPELQHLFTESLLLTASCYLVNNHREQYPRPFPAKLSNAEETPAIPDNRTIIGFFGQLYKIEPKLMEVIVYPYIAPRSSALQSLYIQVWLQIIDRVPNSTLWLLRFPEQAADNVMPSSYVDGRQYHNPSFRLAALPGGAASTSQPAPQSWMS